MLPELKNRLDILFIRYYFIIYYLYIMSVNVLIPKGGLFGDAFNGILILFLLYATIRRFSYCAKFSYIYMYLIFLLFLIFIQSSNIVYSITNYLKFAMGMLCLPLGFSLISTVVKFKEFCKTGLILVAMYLIYILMANIFNFGNFYGYSRGSEEDLLQIGNVFADGLYVNVYVIFLIFLLLAAFPNKKKLILLILSIAAIITVVNMKRMVIAVLCLGLMIFIAIIFFNAKKIKVV